jgi:hypothetical protein
MASRSLASSAESGSSRRNSLGFRASARAIATRWRWPPDSCETGRSMTPDQLEQLLGPLAAGALVDAPDLEAVGDVLADRKVREQGERLKHHAEVALVRGRTGEVLAVEPDATGGRRLQARNAAQQGGLAAARWPEQADQLAVRELEIDIDQRRELAERLAHMVDAQGHDFPPRGSIAIRRHRAAGASGGLPDRDRRQPAIISVHF